VCVCVCVCVRARACVWQYEKALSIREATIYAHNINSSLVATADTYVPYEP
jgi:hypothetical protein